MVFPTENVLKVSAVIIVGIIVLFLIIIISKRRRTVAAASYETPKYLGCAHYQPYHWKANSAIKFPTIHDVMDVVRREKPEDGDDIRFVSMQYGSGSAADVVALANAKEYDSPPSGIDAKDLNCEGKFKIYQVME